jgi:hypothetical protein
VLVVLTVWDALFWKVTYVVNYAAVEKSKIIELKSKNNETR